MEDEIDLKEYFNVIKKHWKIIVLAMIIGAIGGLVKSSKELPIYEAKATIMVRTGGGGGGSIANLAGIAGINLPSGGGQASEIMDLIQSRAVAARVLESLNLKERIKGWNDPKISDQALTGAVQGMLKKPSSSGSLIEIKVVYGDKELVAEIANGFVDAIDYYLQKVNITEARKKREYIESQLPKVEEKLKTVENKLKQSNMLSSNKPEFGGLGNSNSMQAGDRLSLEYAIQNSIYNMLKTQYENVKLDEAKEIPSFLVIDRALMPESDWKPRTKQNILMGLVIGLFTGIFIVSGLEYLKKIIKG